MRILLKFPFLVQIQKQNYKTINEDQCALLEESIYRQIYSANIGMRRFQTNFLEFSFRSLHILSPHSVEELLLLKKELLIRVSIGLAEISRDPVVGSGRRRRRKTRGMPGTRKEQGFSRRIPVAHTERQNLIRLALKQPAKKGINAIPISRTD